MIIKKIIEALMAFFKVTLPILPIGGTVLKKNTISTILMKKLSLNGKVYYKVRKDREKSIEFNIHIEVGSIDDCSPPLYIITNQDLIIKDVITRQSYTSRSSSMISNIVSSVPLYFQKGDNLIIDDKHLELDVKELGGGCKHEAI